MDKIKTRILWLMESKRETVPRIMWISSSRWMLRDNSKCNNNNTYRTSSRTTRTTTCKICSTSRATKFTLRNSAAMNLQSSSSTGRTCHLWIMDQRTHRAATRTVDPSPKTPIMEMGEESQMIAVSQWLFRFTRAKGNSPMSVVRVEDS